VGGEIYNVYDRPPKVPGVCDRDGGKLVQRADDAPEVVKARLVAYERQTKPVSDYYQRHGVLETVDGEADIEEVSERVGRIVESAATRDGHL
jgi:adenylate kinase